MLGVTVAHPHFCSSLHESPPAYSGVGSGDNGPIDVTYSEKNAVPRRRTVLQILTALLTLPLTATTLLLARARNRQRRGSVSVPYPNRDGVFFYDDVILTLESSELIALSARCPHLGCRIQRQEAGELVCPCHGSRFSLVGECLRGPATADLSKLNLERRMEPSGAEIADIELPD